MGLVKDLVKSAGGDSERGGMEKERREGAGVTLSGSGDAKGPFGGGVDGVVGINIGKCNKAEISCGD